MIESFIGSPVGTRKLTIRKEVSRGFCSALAVLILWEILARLLLENELLIPPPSSIFRSLWRLGSTGQLNEHFLVTLQEFLYGFTFACLFGIVLGYFMREKAGRYEGKKAPSYLQYVDTTIVEEAKKQLGWK